MTQEDGYVEVRTNLFNRTPFFKWFRPVYIRRLRLLFDTYCLVIVSRESDMDFADIDNMNMEEYLAWMVYGGHCSYMLLHQKSPGITVEDAVRWVRGILHEDRLKIWTTIKDSKALGVIAGGYQDARNDSQDPGGGASKKESPSEQRS